MVAQPAHQVANRDVFGARLVFGLKADMAREDADSHGRCRVDDLHRVLTESYVGKHATLNVIRGTEMLKLDLVPEEAP